jgi:hypothetical protein
MTVSGLSQAPPFSCIGSQASSCPPCSPTLVQLPQIEAEGVPQSELGFGGVYAFLNEIGARLAAMYRAS